MSYIRTASMLALLVLLLSACEQELVEPDVEPLTTEEISAERLWERIMVEAPYESYSFWPGEEGIQPGQAPHGPFHRVFVNKTLYQSVPVSDAAAPNGSLIVKENLDTARELTSFTVMAKVSGFDPEHGDWFWARYLADGSVAAAGSVQSCIVCHAGMRENDYIIIDRIDEPFPEDE